MYLLTFVAIVTAISATRAVSPTVELGYSSYKGTALSNGVTQWLGMRFAAAPLGPLRFKAPEDPPSQKSVQDATQFGNICYGVGHGLNATPAESEDCLFINVFAPSHAKASSKLPAYLFISGGGFSDLSNANYNGSGLIEASDMNVIIVNFNYRVGPYGFLASEEVQKNGDTNAGLLDQRQAMRWVQQHISEFGGDPGQVILGGDSAGAISITLHLVAYDAAPNNMFHAFMAESQGFPAMLSVPQSQFIYDALVERTGCDNQTDTLACLRNLDIDVLQTANIDIPFQGRQTAPLYTYSPTLDGTLLVDYTQKLYQEGRFLKKPGITGDTTNEGTIFTPTNLNTTVEMNGFLQDQFPNLTTSDLAIVDQLYPKGQQFPNHGAYFSAAAAAYGEMRYICPGILVTDSFVQYGASQSTYNYHYNVTDPTQVEEGEGVPHTVEINAIWGPNNVGGGAPASYFTTNAAMVPVMQGYWTSFMRTLNPNTHRAAGTPSWEVFSHDESRILLMTNASKMEQVPADQKTRCNFWKSIGISIGQ